MDNCRPTGIIISLMVGALIALLLVIWLAPLTKNKDLVEHGAARYKVDETTGEVTLEFCDCFRKVE